MVYRIGLAIALFGLVTICSAEGFLDAGELLGTNPYYQAMGEPYTINSPTAWTRARGTFDIHLALEPFLIKGSLGLANWLNFGVSYGGEAVIGQGDPVMNPHPGFQAKVQLVNGNEVLPAIAVGYDDQGSGVFVKDENFPPARPELFSYDRYLVKSKGIYAVASQEYDFLGYIGLHLGANYNMTETNDDKSPDAWASIEKSIGPIIDLVGVYDLGANDNSSRAFGGDGPGFLDAGIRFRIAPEFRLEFYTMNLLNNQKTVLGEEGKWSRVLAFTYVITF